MFKSTIAFIIALGFFLIGISMFVKRIKQLKNNTATTQATIIDFERQETYDSDTGYSTSYFPIIRYYVNGVEYIKKDEYGSSGKRKDIGKVININYNPENPEEFNISNQIISWILPAIVTIIGFVVTLLMINW